MIRACSAPPAKLTSVFPDYDFAYIGVPKCASQTMRKALFQDGMSYPVVPQSEALKYKHRIAIIRHPLDRTFSAWNHIWSAHEFGDWWAHVKQDTKWDIHTFPAAEWMAEAEPNEIYRLEEWDQWWPDLVVRFPGLLPDVMPWKNHSPRDFDVDSYSEFHEDILSVYAGDLALWEACEWRAAA